MMVVSFLKITEAQYENLRLEIWLRWCEAKSMSTREWQQLMANSTLNRWFNTELVKREWQFMHDVAFYRHKVDKITLQDRYVAYMDNLNNLFLKPEQDRIRKTVKQINYDDIKIFLN